MFNLVTLHENFIIEGQEIDLISRENFGNPKKNIILMRDPWKHKIFYKEKSGAFFKFKL